MERKLNKQNKEYVIIEGIADIKRKEEPLLIKLQSGKNCLYSGNCSVSNGIDKLIKAFLLLKDKGFILHIFGHGDYCEEIKKISETEHCIKYYGMRDNETVIAAQKKMDLLINPRPSNKEFTKYSFPSKNIEYMTSGVPLLTTCLPGIPNEYYKYIYMFDKETAEDMAAKIVEIFSIAPEVRVKMAEKAKEFVIKEKNNKLQTAKIITLLKDH